MVRHHKKTKKHSRRRRRSMRGGGEWLKPWTWGKTDPTSPVAVATTGVAKTVTDTTAAVAPSVPAPDVQADALGVPSGSAGVLGPDASLPAAMGGRRRRRTRKHRRRH